MLYLNQESNYLTTFPCFIEKQSPQHSASVSGPTQFYSVCISIYREEILTHGVRSQRRLAFCKIIHTSFIHFKDFSMQRKIIYCLIQQTNWWGRSCAVATVSLL